MGSLILYLAPLLFFLLLALFFSASETAFMAVDRLRLRYLAESGDRTAASVQQIVANPDRLLGVILLGSTVSNIAAASIVTYMVTAYSPHSYLESISILSSVVLTLVVLIFCELSPKILAATNAEKVARTFVWPIRFAIRVLSPPARLASWIANQLVRLAGFSADASPFAHALSEDEIRSIIASAAAGGLAERKKEMLENVFEIAATQVRSVMIPRIEVTAIEIDQPVPEILALIRKTNYSRLPVYRKDFDNVVGILYVKDLLQHLERPEAVNIQVLLRPVHYVPDTARLEAVLRQLQSMHLHMAVVVNEFGGVEGIVTLEDLLEEIVGEIRDEHDTEVESVRELGPNLFSIAGNLAVKDFNRMFEVKLPDSPDYTTVVGFLQARTGRLLHEGEIVRYQDATFVIEKLDGFRTLSVRVRVPRITADAHNGAAVPSPNQEISI